MATIPLPPAMGSILDFIGNTPMVELSRLPKSFGIEAEIFAKLEYQNAGGSIKDRVAKAMVESAEKTRRIKPGDTLIEASSGNT